MEMAYDGLPTGEYLWPPDYFHPLNPRVDKIIKGSACEQLQIHRVLHLPGDSIRLRWQTGSERNAGEPVNMLPYAPPAGRNMLTTSMAAKGWADYLIAGLETPLKYYGFNGIY